ncbi:hypothetical protein BH93_19390 [Rhodococcoides fascians A25f]|uniref:hypothetical protein n=1 Tax=Rhodococcoides fascians TaxID=1828 RepID=UPI00056A1EE1|nr:hypothetical protein [Rhodococcus fascians]QII07242.1 hypothetical protein BH93_19390 [Rhodococcus fascians A25f]
MSVSLATLDPILGRWRTSGTVVDRHGNLESEIAGTDSYTALPGGQWIAHDVDVTIGVHRTLAHELIGGSHPDGGWRMYAFDEASEPGLMRLTLHDNGPLLLEGNGIRSWFHFRAGTRHMTTRWEQFDGDGWTTWMSMRFDRIG